VPEVRKPRAGEASAVAQLLYLSGADMYDRFSGGRERALRVLELAFDTPGTVASAECVRVVELDGRVAAAMSAFPVDEAPARSRAFLQLALRASPFWRWPRVMRLYRAGGRASPSPPASALYVDALATDERLRRRGAARTLLAEAERQARAQNLPCVALDTTIPNEVARSLYAREGFDEVAYRPAGKGLPGFVALVKRLDCLATDRRP
jgi:ribosomal protein S18 acetylase RimI-like enzyme